MLVTKEQFQAAIKYQEITQVSFYEKVEDVLVKTQGFRFKFLSSGQIEVLSENNAPMPKNLTLFIGALFKNPSQILFCKESSFYLIRQECVADNQIILVYH